MLLEVFLSPPTTLRSESCPCYTCWSLSGQSVWEVNSFVAPVVISSPQGHWIACLRFRGVAEPLSVQKAGKNLLQSLFGQASFKDSCCEHPSRDGQEQQWQKWSMGWFEESLVIWHICGRARSVSVSETGKEGKESKHQRTGMPRVVKCKEPPCKWLSNLGLIVWLCRCPLHWAGSVSVSNSPVGSFWANEDKMRSS